MEKHIKFTPEVKIDKDTSEIADIHCIAGHCDGIFEDMKARWRMGLEIKSMSGASFAALRRPSDQYLTQATVYMACLGLEHMMFVFVDKNASLIQPILYDFSTERWEAISAMIQGVIEKVMLSKSVPKKVDPWACKNICNYYWLCKPKA